MSQRTDTFEILGENPGMSFGVAGSPAMVFLIQDGRIQRAPSDFSSCVGLPFDVLRDDRPAFSRRAR
jgi:hypothetical protein